LNHVNIFDESGIRREIPQNYYDRFEYAFFFPVINDSCSAAPIRTALTAFSRSIGSAVLSRHSFVDM
jgi:hypothetical protein